MNMNISIHIYIYRIDTLDQFVRSTSIMSISELKLMRSSSHVLITALFRSLHRLIIGGIITALGVCACHFIGMASVVSDGMIEWQAGEV
jgi:NO-binding membrane sensor protein with MHYT domain